LTTSILIDIDNFFNNDVIMSSPALISLTAQEVVKWVMAGSRLPGAFTQPTRRNSTSLLANLFRLVETVAKYSCEFRTHFRCDRQQWKELIVLMGLFIPPLTDYKCPRVHSKLNQTNINSESVFKILTYASDSPLASH